MKYLIIGAIITGVCKFTGTKFLATAMVLNSVPIIGGLLGFIPKILGSVLVFIGWFFYVFLALIAAILLFKLFKAFSKRKAKRAAASAPSVPYIGVNAPSDDAHYIDDISTPLDDLKKAIKRSRTF